MLIKMFIGYLLYYLKYFHIILIISYYIKKDSTIIYIQKYNEWGYIEIKNNLNNIIQSLNQKVYIYNYKGLREKKLYDNLNYYL